VIARILLFLKHRAPFLWRGIEWVNGLLFRLLHAGRMKDVRARVLAESTHSQFHVRELELADRPGLQRLLERQGEQRTRHFRPHGFDRASLERAFANPAFIMFGVFEDGSLVGYFFLRCFWNRRCFVGRLIDEPHERRGIGRLMNGVMYHTAWRSGFRCLSTISRNNAMVMRSHANNPTMKVLDELPDDYLFVEFVPPRDVRQRTT
jgi:hypothetical protein